MSAAVSPMPPCSRFPPITSWKLGRGEIPSICVRIPRQNPRYSADVRNGPPPFSFLAESRLSACADAAYSPQNFDIVLVRIAPQSIPLTPELRRQYGPVEISASGSMVLVVCRLGRIRPTRITVATEPYC